MNLREPSFALPGTALRPWNVQSRAHGRFVLLLPFAPGGGAIDEPVMRGDCATNPGLGRTGRESFIPTVAELFVAVLDPQSGPDDLRSVASPVDLSA